MSRVHPYLLVSTVAEEGGKKKRSLSSESSSFPTQPTSIVKRTRGRNKSCFPIRAPNGRRLSGSVCSCVTKVDALDCKPFTSSAFAFLPLSLFWLRVKWYAFIRRDVTESKRTIYSTATKGTLPLRVCMVSSNGKAVLNVRIDRRRTDLVSLMSVYVYAWETNLRIDTWNGALEACTSYDGDSSARFKNGLWKHGTWAMSQQISDPSIDCL